MADSKFELLQKMLAAEQAAPKEIWGGNANAMQNEPPPPPQAIPNLDKPMQQMQLAPKNNIPNPLDVTDEEAKMKAQAAAERFKALIGRQ